MTTKDNGFIQIKVPQTSNSSHTHIYRQLTTSEFFNSSAAHFSFSFSSRKDMGVPHFLAIPFPVQGHVNPLMQLSHALAKNGCKVTFLNTEFSHKRAKNAAGAAQHEDGNLDGSNMNFVTLPDGLGPEDDRSNPEKVLWSIKSTMPNLLPKLIEDINALDGENKITCIVVTINMGWALEVGHKLGIKGAVLFPGSATSMASAYCIPRLIDDGVIDSDGKPTKKQEIQLSPNMPMMDTAQLAFWVTLSKIFFYHLVQEVQTMMLGEWWLCNTAYDLEPGAFSISPRFLPIGPSMESDDTNKSSFWPEDTTCLEWLDKQQPKSVIYVSFGSLAVMESNQFKELALALDLLDKPFLWVVRPAYDDNNAYPDEFHGSKGKIVGWAPQKKILCHPAVACFVSHCGWNSTIEGVYSGVPFLCWPFFTDQFQDKSYICDVWKVGLGLDKDENGFIPKEEIRKKVELLLGDEGIRARSLKLKEVTRNNVAEGGQSSKNLEKFINWAK